MMFTMILSVMALICGVLVHGGRSEELSKIVPDSINVMSGYYDNLEQIVNGSKGYYFMQAWFIPVHVPVFGSKPVFLLMEAREGAFLRVQLNVVNSTGDNVIKVTPYNFTDPSLYKPGDIPLKELDNLTLDQLHTDQDCVITFKFVSQGIITGQWPDCLLTVNGTHPRYDITFNCEEIIVVPPIGALERRERPLYVGKRKGEKYELVNASDNYVGPCDKQP